jgi:hypothetical protein
MVVTGKHPTPENSLCAPGASLSPDKWTRHPAPGILSVGVNMPRIKRWFPVNHDINRDPELWDLCDKFGEKALRCWLEILSIADRNEGDVPGTLNSISTAVGWAIRCKTTKTLRILNEIMTLGWLRVDDGLKVTNYAKYHKTREPQKIPLASLPSEPSEPSEPKNAVQPPAAPVDNSKNGPEPKRGLDPRIKEVADRIYHKDPDRFRRLITWIKDKEKRDYPVEVIVETLSQFEARDRNTKIKDWWPYMERIHTKVYGQWNEAQAARVKDSENKFVLSLVTTVGGGMKP